MMVSAVGVASRAAWSRLPVAAFWVLAGRAALADISNAQLAERAGREWALLPDEALSALLDDPAALSGQLYSGEYLDALMRVVRRRSFYTASAAEVRGKIWRAVLLRRDEICERAKRSGELLGGTVDLRSFLFAELDDFIGPVVAEADETIMMADAFDAFVAGDISVAATLDSLKWVAYLKLLESVARGGNRGGPDTVVFMGRSIHCLSAEGCREYSYELTRKGWNGTTGTGVLDSHNGPYWSNPIAGFAGMLMRYLTEREAALRHPGALQMRIAELHEAVRPLRTDPAVIDEIKRPELWTQQRERVVSAIELAGGYTRRNATLPILAFLVYDVRRFPPAEREPPAQDVIVKALSAMGGQAADPVLEAYLSGTLPVEYAAEILQGALTGDVALAWLAAQRGRAASADSLAAVGRLEATIGAALESSHGTARASSPVEAGAQVPASDGRPGHGAVASPAASEVHTVASGSTMGRVLSAVCSALFGGFVTWLVIRARRRAGGAG